MRRRWHHTPLRLQLALVVAAVLLVLLATFSAVLYLGVRLFLLQQTAQQLRGSAQSAITEILPRQGAASGRRGAPTGAERAQLAALADYLTEPRTSAVIYGLDGKGLARGKTAQVGKTNPRLPPAPPRPPVSVLSRVANSPRFMATPNGVHQLGVLVPLRNGSGDLVAVLQLATPIGALDELLRTFGRYLIGSSALTIVGAMTLSALASARVLRPLQTIVAASTRVAHGDLATRLALPPGNEIGQVGAAFDHMVARTAESFAAQQRFVADAAHELRTPLTAIGGTVEMLQMGAVDGQPEKRRRMLQTITNEIDRLTRLVNQLLLLNTLEQPRAAVCVPCDLRPLLAELAEQMRLVAPDHRWQTHLPTPLPVLGDHDQLHQVLLNLLTNAHTYTPVGGTITVTGTAAEVVSISIADTGIGIPADDLAHVHERLYRVDRARSRTAGGFGLGLAIVQTIIAAHNGHMQLASTPGQGTTVTITLPLHKVSV